MRNLFVFLILALGLAACGLPTSTPAPTPVSTFTAIPSLTPTALPPTEAGFTLPQYDPAQIVYDFTANLCAAQWGNGHMWFTGCPGDLTNITEGYYAALGVPAIEGTTVYHVPAIVVLPSQYAIFAKYPPFTVQAGDEFRAVLACQGDSPCNVQFALEYFDQAGEYHPNASDGTWPLQWNHVAGEGPVAIAVDLSGLAGQTVQFTLAVRDEGNTPTADYALWVQPVILR